MEDIQLKKMILELNGSLLGLIIEGVSKELQKEIFTKINDINVHLDIVEPDKAKRILDYTV